MESSFDWRRYDSKWDLEMVEGGSLWLVEVYCANSHAKIRILGWKLEIIGNDRRGESLVRSKFTC